MSGYLAELKELTGYGLQSSPRDFRGPRDRPGDSIFREDFCAANDETEQKSFSGPPFGGSTHGGSIQCVALCGGVRGPLEGFTFLA